MIRKSPKLPSTASVMFFGLKNSRAISLHLFGGDRFDALQHFIQSEKALEIEILTRQIAHAAGGGFQSQHEGTFQVVLGAAQLLGRNQIFLQLAELLHDGIDHLAGRFPPPCRHKSPCSRCRDTWPARNRRRRPSPAFRGCSGTGANSSRHPEWYSAYSRRSAARAEKDKRARPCRDGSARAKSCCEIPGARAAPAQLRERAAPFTRRSSKCWRARSTNSRVVQIAGGGDQNIRRRIVTLEIGVDHSAIERREWCPCCR